MATNRYTVVYELNSIRRKLCTVLLTSDGSFFVTCPYHESDLVSVMKRTVNYTRQSQAYKTPAVEYGLLEDDEHRLKLSHHPDGFVQFSGHNILSGRDENGHPKGIGLMSWPMTKPTAGPVCGVTILNPSAFKEARTPRQGDICFSADDIYSADEDTGLMVEMFYFPGIWRRFVRPSSRGPVLWLKHPSGSVLELRVCKSPPDNWSIGFLGVDVWSCPIKFGNAISGFALTSSSGNLRYNENKELEGELLTACYPALGENDAIPKILMFPARNDPPYTEDEPPPSSD